MGATGFAFLLFGLLPAAAGASDGRAKPFLEARFASAAPYGAEDLCGRFPWACASTGRAGRLTRRQIALADRVNRQVNRRVREIPDRVQYRRAERWALPTARGGDCEDFALLKKRELVRLGLPPERLLIAAVVEAPGIAGVMDARRDGHAVLILRTDEGDFVLDNLDNRLRHWSRTPYTFLRMQNPTAPHSWVGVFAGR